MAFWGWMATKVTSASQTETHRPGGPFRQFVRQRSNLSDGSM